MKIAVVGAGNGGSFTALHFGWYTRDKSDVEVELIYDPEIKPERVGQATLLDPPGLLWAATDFNWYTSYSRYSMLVVVFRESSPEYEQYAIRSCNQTTRRSYNCH